MKSRASTRLLMASALLLFAGCKESFPVVEFGGAHEIAHASDGRRVLIVAPHPDDEALIAAGVIRSAVNAGETVYVALVTNGDILGKPFGLMREQETMDAMARLGVDPEHVIFLGYGDGTLSKMWSLALERKGGQVVNAKLGHHSTYANQGMGGTDFHSLRNGVPAEYSARNFIHDLEDLMFFVQPTEIYSTSEYDQHGDHQGLNRFLLKTFERLQTRGVKLPKFFEAVVHFDVNHVNLGSEAFAPDAKAPVPKKLASLQAPRGKLTHIPVPPEMLDPSSLVNLKAVALREYRSQWGAEQFMLSFVRSTEVFWRRISIVIPPN